MRKITTLSAAIFFVAAIGAFSTLAHAGAADDAEIKALEARYSKAVEAKDIDALMANYVPGDSLVVFDIIPPRQYMGWDAYKKDWAGVIAGCADSPKLEVSNLAIESDRKLAFSHSIQHFACTDSKGAKLEMTMRATDAYRKVNGKWLIVHEHLSAPIDLATGKADLTSKP
jgi:ketosteroid isomerase-like protein